MPSVIGRGGVPVSGGNRDSADGKGKVRKRRAVRYETRECVDVEVLGAGKKRKKRRWGSRKIARMWERTYERVSE
jgi:hypothetical protein